MSTQNNITLSIKTVDDIVRCISLSSLLEISGWPKPGNVHRTKDFNDTRFEHFLAAIAGIQPEYYKFCERIGEDFKTHRSDLSYIELGTFYKVAAERMMQWQKGGNVILGHILILSPLASAAVISLKRNLCKINEFKSIVKEVISNATIKDTVKLYKAINTCNPGGLGNVDKYDLTDIDSIVRIQKDKITLKKIFELSQEYDLISREYSTGFNIILNEGLPYYLKIFAETRDINIATVHTFLHLLSTHYDTLIIRKSGREKAKVVSEKAANALQFGGLLTQKGRNIVQKMDLSLQKKQGKLNPGTTADLLAGVIFCALLFGLKF